MRPLALLYSKVGQAWDARCQEVARDLEIELRRVVTGVASVGAGCRAQRLGFRVKGLGFASFKAERLGFRVLRV